MNTELLKLLFEYIDARIAELSPNSDTRDILRRMEAENELFNVCPETHDP